MEENGGEPDKEEDYSDLTMVQNIEMINFLISVRRKAYLDTLQLEIHRSRMG